MANLPLGFAMAGGGAVLLVCGLQNKTPRQVLLGEASTAPSVVPATGGAASTPAASSGSTPSAPLSGIPGVSGSLGDTKGAKAAETALTFTGDPYVLGGLSKLGIDCSGLVKEAYQAVGIDLPHNAALQWQYVKAHGTVKQLSDVVAGDLIFLEPTASGPDHVAIALGNGMAVEAPHTGDVVKTISLATLTTADGFVGAGSPYQ